MALILLRHTRPAVADGRCYGATDHPCDADFELASVAIVAGLPRFDHIVSSPLRRCKILAELIAEGRSLALTTDERLREMDFGTWEGRPWSRIDAAEIDAWAADFHNARPHGGESVAMLTARTQAVLSELRCRTGTTLVVTHLGVMRASLAIAGQADAWQKHVEFGAWITESEVEHVSR